MCKYSERKKKNGWLKWLFPLTGILALIWFLVRVLPKPSRVLYPCQKVAAPLAGGFLLWLSGLAGSVFAFDKIRRHIKNSRMGWVAFFLVILLAAGTVAVVNIPQEEILAVATDANAPIGTAKGIHPGRVTWAYNPDATDWDGYSSSDHWWESDHTDMVAVEKMVSQVIRGTAGQSTDATAWEAIFKYNNRNRGKGDTGYTVGEKIAIKANLVTCIEKGGYVDSTTYVKNEANMNQIDTSPQVLLALLRHLVNVVGASQADITVGDPTALFPKHYWDILHSEFPDVHYWDNLGGAGRSRAEFSTVPFYWSTSEADGKIPDYLPQAFADADYIINLAVLKGHSSGITLCSKNHFGTLIRCPDGYVRDLGTVDYYNTHLSLPNAVWSPGMGRYRSQVDLMGHPGIYDKTMLYMLDGLYAGYYWDAVPQKWKSAPFGDGVNGDWPSSMFASLDAVAIDSVGYDFLLAEWPDVVNTGGGPSLQGGAEDYLHEAAQADNPDSGTVYDPDNDGSAMSSLGTHEHWNNSASKQYSRNLGTGDGIELFSISNINGGSAEMAVNRSRLNFAYVIGGDTPPSQTFSISKSGSGNVSWIVNEDASWLNCTPSSGNNAAKVAFSINTSGLTAGTLSTEVTIADLNSTASTKTVTVHLTVYSSGGDVFPFGTFDTPVADSTVYSSIAVTGWVLDDVYVEGVKIYRESGSDVVFIGDALLVDGARPDVESAYPTHPFNYRAGWGYMLLTNFLPYGGNGTFTLRAVATDSSGHTTTLGTKTITCDNANAVKPFGAIDTPAAGGEVSGAGYRVNGWALTPMPNSIPADGATISVYIDGVGFGTVNYNNYRPDIAGLFPGYANSDGAHGYLDIDTADISNGVRTIYWIATDNAGNADGIGSRYFTVQNSGGALRTNSPALRTASPALLGNIDTIPMDQRLPVYVRKGTAKNGELYKIQADENGLMKCRAAQLERVVIHLDEKTLEDGPFKYRDITRKGAGVFGFAAYQLVAKDLRPLPIGSTFDVRRGVFYWHPGPGFLGEFRFVFVSPKDTGQYVKREVTVNIAPRKMHAFTK